MSKHYDRFQNRKMEVLSSELRIFAGPTDYLKYENNILGVFESPEEYKDALVYFNADWSRYLTPHTISQAERDADYDHAVWESKFYGYELGDDFPVKAYRDSYMVYCYLYGDATIQSNHDDDLEVLDTAEELPLVARFCEHHARAKRRAASLKAKTWHIALGFPNLPDSCRHAFSIKDNAFEHVDVAKHAIDVHEKAREAIANLNSGKVHGYSHNTLQFLLQFKKSELLHSRKLSISDVFFDEATSKYVPIYERYGANMYIEALRISQKGKSVIKLAKHYTGFSAKKGVFFKSLPKGIDSTTSTTQTDKVLKKGPKVAWTQEEILATKLAEVPQASPHQHGLPNKAHTALANKLVMPGKHLHNFKVTNPRIIQVTDSYLMFVPPVLFVK